MATQVLRRETQKVCWRNISAAIWACGLRAARRFPGDNREKSFHSLMLRNRFGCTPSWP